MTTQNTTTAIHITNLAQYDDLAHLLSEIGSAPAIIHVRTELEREYLDARITVAKGEDSREHITVIVDSAMPRLPKDLIGLSRRQRLWDIQEVEFSHDGFDTFMRVFSHAADIRIDPILGPSNLGKAFYLVDVVNEDYDQIGHALVDFDPTRRANAKKLRELIDELWKE